MVMPGARRGAQLPYQLLAGIVPCSGGWLAATSKLQGVTLSPEEPQVFPRFVDVLDYKPAYQVIAAFVPIGLPSEPTAKGRHCERDARELLGWPRAGSIISAPVRRALQCSTYEAAVEANGGSLNPVSWYNFKRIAEVDRQIAPYWQRTVFEVHPELSFYQLNEDSPVRFPKRRVLGIEERRTLLEAHLPGVEKIVDSVVVGVTKAQLLDAAACLWTARRIASRAVARLPEDPEWDELGLRMEIVR